LRAPTAVFDPDAAHAAQGIAGAEPDPIGSGRAGLVDEVAHVLRQRIYGGIYPPGELLRQVQLSEELNVSRTPLREALRLLQSEGLVVPEGARGVSVVRLEGRRLLNAFALREVLDGLAARQAAERGAHRAEAELGSLVTQQRAALSPWQPAEYVRLNVEFHARIIELSGNEFLRGQMSLVRMTSTIFAPTVLINPERASLGVEDHRKLVEAIKQGRAAEAEALSRGHIRETMACLAQAPGLSSPTTTIAEAAAFTGAAAATALALTAAASALLPAVGW